VKTVALCRKIVDILYMPRRNPQTEELPPGKKSESHWPGKTGDPNAFPEDTHNRWFPTSWGAGFGPELDSPVSGREKRSERDSQALGISAPSFEIGILCPNCGFARMTLDADEQVSCPLCNFGGLCECSD